MIHQCYYCELNTAGEHASNCPMFHGFTNTPMRTFAPQPTDYVVSKSDFDALRAERDGLLVSRELYRNLAIQYEKLLLRIREWDNNGNVDGPWLTEWIDEAIGRFPKSEA